MFSAQMKTTRRGFTLIELLVTISIIAVLAVLALAALFRSQRSAEQADSTAQLRTMSQAVLTYAGEHDNSLPGPLWPGQVMLYDPAREGRLVREVGEYMPFEKRPEAYLVESLIPKAYRRAMKGANLADARIYVMNTAVEVNGATANPFGNLPTDPALPSLKLVTVASLPEEERWMMKEADQQVPEVATASWRANTPPAPVHGTLRAAARFDGSVTWEKAK